MKVFAYDPGVSTGWVLVEDEEVSEFGQFVSPDHVHATRILEDLIDRFQPDVIVAEEFNLRPGNKFIADLTPVQINAIMDVNHKIVYQTPAQAKHLVSNNGLKNLGFWPTGKTVGYKDANDVRDAARHAFYYIIITLRSTAAARRMTAS